MDVAIDHVVMTMALRSGVVRCVDPVLRTVVMEGSVLDSHQMGALREVTASAMGRVGCYASVEFDRTDDLLWYYGRKALRCGTPLDDPATMHGELDARLQLPTLADIVAVLNGLDQTAPDDTRLIPVVRGPFTKFL